MTRIYGPTLYLTYNQLKGKETGLQGRFLQINLKALYVLCANHLLNLAVAGSAKSSTKTLFFFGVLTQLYVHLLSSTQRGIILKKNVLRSLKSQSATRWESRIHCISPLRYHLTDVVKALKELESYCLEKKNNEAINNVRKLILGFESWSFILSIAIWHDPFFQINKTSKVMQTSGVSLEAVETEIKAKSSLYGGDLCA